MKFKRLTCYGHNAKTSEIEQFISNAFFKREYPMNSVSSQNVKIVAEALFKEYKRNYCISDIDLSLLTDNGVEVCMQLEPLDDWNKDGFYEKEWLYRHLKPIIDVLGKPSSVVESGGKYYAMWVRNMVIWF